MDRACQPSEGSSKAKQVCLQRGIQMQNQLAVAPRRPRGPRCDWQGRAQRRRLAAKSVGGSVQGRSCQGQEGGRQAGVRPREKESKEQGQARSVCLSAKPILRAGRQGGKPLFGRKNHRDAGKESPACPLSLGGRGEQGWLADQCAVRPRRSGPGSLSARAQAARRLPPTSSEPGRGGGGEGRCFARRSPHRDRGKGHPSSLAGGAWARPAVPVSRQSRSLAERAANRA